MARHQINNLKNIKEPYRCLSLSVIAHAFVEDSPSSRRWLMSENGSLNMWCEMARIDIDHLHRRVREVQLGKSNGVR
jgi:hypothetical protein